MKASLPICFALLLLGWARPVPADVHAIQKMPDRLMLLPADTWLYATPKPKAQRFRLTRRVPSMRQARKKTPLGLDYTARPRRVLLFQLASPLPEGEGWVHIKPVASDLRVPNGCDFHRAGRGLAVHLYVSKADLLFTLKEPFFANFEEGTGVELKPGVVIRKTRQKGRCIAETPYLQVRLPLDPGATAKSFAPQPGFSLSKAPAWAKGPVKLKINPAIHATLYGDQIGLQAEPVKRGPGRWLMHDVGSCARVTGVGRYRPLNRRPTPGYGGTLSMVPEGAVRLPKGRRVLWSNGKVAGHTDREWILEPDEEVKARAPNYRCYKKPFFSEKKTVLCFHILPKDASQE